MSVTRVLDVRVLRALEFIRGDSYPLLDENTLWHAGRVAGTVQFSHLLHTRLHLILSCALPPSHSRSPVLIEDVQRHGGESVIWVQSVVANIAGRHAKYGYPGGCGYLLFQPVKVRINRFGFPT